MINLITEQTDDSQFAPNKERPVKILLAGCGDLGLRTAARLGSNYTCYGLRRQIEKLPDFVIPLRADLSDTDQVRYALAEGFDVVIATVTPDRYSEESYRNSYITAAKSLLKVIRDSVNPPSLLLWASSTSVYGQDDGYWVDEKSSAKPRNFSGRVILEAEKIINRLPCSKVIRFSGIYGPGRQHLLDRILAGATETKTPGRWSNRIHSEDCAAIFSHFIDLHLEGRVLENLYLATDCVPITRIDLNRWLASKLKVAFNQISDDDLHGRRCCNKRLLDSGFEFLYPSYEEGYGSLINSLKLP